VLEVPQLPSQPAPRVVVPTELPLEVPELEVPQLQVPELPVDDVTDALPDALP
jgi:hypothetical protein